MKKLLLSTALFGAMAIPALAQDQSMFREAPEAMDIRASDFMGMRLYATETAVEGTEAQGQQEGWEDIGEVNDVVLNRDGQVQAVLVDIGGFLGIGERTVAVSMDALQFLSDSATAENADDFFLVMNASREQLEAAPEYTAVQGGEMSAEQAAEETDQAIEDGASNIAAAGAAVGAAAGAAVGTAVEGAENAGENVADAAGAAVEGTENAVEETGAELADAGTEVADEAADAGEEVAEEAGQVGMTDTQEDQAEVADATQDTTEEAAEESTQATAEAADESADQAEAVAEGNATETEMEADQTATAATDTTGADTTAATDEAAGAATTTAVTDTEQTSARTPTAREGFVAAGVEDFTADRLQGAAVYDQNDGRVGEVGEILLSEDGQVSDLVIDVGGFLGIGEKPVALAMDSVDILRQDGGEEIRVYVSQTEDELEGMERYEAQQ